MTTRRLIALVLTLAGLAIGSPALAVVSDATNLFAITKTGFVLNRTTNTYDTTVTIKNTSPLTVNTPVQLVVSGLPSGVTLANAAGKTTQGNAYVVVNAPGGSIIGNAIVTGTVLKFSNPNRVAIAVKLAVIGDIPEPVVGLPPDPGEAGKATVAGIDSNNNGVRDDVERWIVFNIPDSARHRAALMIDASANQRGLTAETKEQAVAAANDGIVNLTCFAYLGIHKKDQKWKQVLALTINTEARLHAYETYQDRINGEVFGMVPRASARAACRFDVEALPH